LIAIIVVVINGLGANRAQAPVSPTLQPTTVAASPTAAVRPSDTPLPVTAQPTDRPAAIPNPPRTPEQVDAIDLTGKNITIVYWHQWSQWNQNLLQAMLGDFNRTNPYGITAKAEPASTSYSGLYNKVNAAILAGQPPELSVAFQGQVALYRSKDVVIDFTPFIQSKRYGLSQADLDDFFPVMLEGDTNPYYAGERLGLPIQRSMDVLYYNADWLKRLGYTAPPQDWRQFEEIACRASDRSKNKFGWAFHHDATNWVTFVFAHGGRILSEDGQAYVFNSDAGVDAVKMIQHMFEKGCAVEVPTNDNFGEETRFAQGEALFVFASSASLPFYADAVNKAGKFKWDIAMPPNSGKPAITLYGPSVSLHKTTPEKELAAWLVVKFLSEKSQTTQWSVETGYLPIRNSAKAGTLAGLRADNFYRPVADLYGKLFDWLPSSMPEPSAAGYDGVRLLIDRDVISKVISDPKADAKILLDAAVEKAKDTLR
jgi:multiple sugar transport system substrate-binding protein/sn-glycerol 3-phosphate transport system substrate-binding protein